MSLPIRTRLLARQDLVDIFTRIGQNNPDAATRFLKAANETIERLAERPGLGSSLETSNPELEGLRFRLVKGFKKYLILYIPQEDSIDVVRVLHGARDIQKLLDE